MLSNWWQIMSDLSRTFFHPVLRELTRDFTDGSHFAVDVEPQLFEIGCDNIDAACLVGFIIKGLLMFIFSML